MGRWTRAGRRRHGAACALVAILALIAPGCRSADRTNPVAGGGRDPQDCIKALKQEATGVIMYAQDYNGVFPRRGNFAAVSQAVNHYTKTDGVPNCPVTGRPYLFNTAVSGISLVNIQRPAETTLFKDSAPHPDGTVEVAFTDAHVKQYPAGDPQVNAGTFR